jgi:integrase
LKDLTETARQEQAQREGTETNSAKAEVKGKILEFEWWLKKGGYRESTILGYASVLKSLVNKAANLLDPNSVKETIAMQDQWSIGRKAVAAKAYTKFLEKIGLKWQKPIYEAPRKLPFIPAEKELDDLIAGTTAKTSTFLQLLKETGMRAGEAYQLKWTDLDFANNTVRITPEKHSNPRIFRLSNRLIAMLNRLPHTKETIFTFKRLNHLRRTYQRQRKRIAHKFGNPRLTQITFHTFRHWKATTEYHKTKDILYVMQLLGHKNIKNTLIYTQLISTKEDDFVCKAAKTVDEARKLVEAGFEFVCEIQDCRIFRKRK